MFITLVELLFNFQFKRQKLLVAAISNQIRKQFRNIDGLDFNIIKRHLHSVQDLPNCLYNLDSHKKMNIVITVE